MGVIEGPSKGTIERGTEYQSNDGKRKELSVHYRVCVFSGPKGHQCKVIVGMGKRKPSATYKLKTATLWDEILVETSLTPWEW